MDFCTIMAVLSFLVRVALVSAADYYQMEQGTCCCPKADRISNKQECVIARDQLGLPAAQAVGTISTDVDCVWGEWGEWATCTATCGAEQQTRDRVKAVVAVGNGQQCTGVSRESRDCGLPICGNLTSQNGTTLSSTVTAEPAKVRTPTLTPQSPTTKRAFPAGVLVPAPVMYVVTTLSTLSPAALSSAQTTQLFETCFEIEPNQDQSRFLLRPYSYIPVTGGRGEDVQLEDYYDMHQVYGFGAVFSASTAIHILLTPTQSSNNWEQATAKSRLPQVEAFLFINSAQGVVLSTVRIVWTSTLPVRHQVICGIIGGGAIVTCFILIVFVVVYVRPRSGVRWCQYDVDVFGNPVTLPFSKFKFLSRVLPTHYWRGRSEADATDAYGVLFSACLPSSAWWVIPSLGHRMSSPSSLVSPTTAVASHCCFLRCQSCCATPCPSSFVGPSAAMGTMSSTSSCLCPKCSSHWTSLTSSQRESWSAASTSSPPGSQ
eukprot:NODE_398_length_1701_cov_192.932203_g317_i0.p1 GENE.NODE_398_length_1701_cov_192.932203_g317_i0~~NODE_398_length_1701_cov_192.932203_g317_i0.p1  ORF type:complete len:488 (-),score=75.64 NODE_398_length_1701_cov_192.932203_g317_i0:130-1593(-)